MNPQEPDPPDLRLMVLAVIMLLRDLAEERLSPDMRARVFALRNAVERFKDTSL